MSEVPILWKLTLITWRPSTESIISAGAALTQVAIKDGAHILSLMCKDRCNLISTPQRFQHSGIKLLDEKVASNEINVKTSEPH